MIKGKKGDLLDTFVMMVVPIFFIMVFVFALILHDNWTTSINTISSDIPGATEIQAANNNNNSRLGAFLDFGVIILIFGVTFVIYMSAFFLANHPVFIWVYMVMAPIFALITFFFGPAFVGFFRFPYILNYMNSMPMSLWIMDNYLIVELFFIIGLGVMLYLKPSALRVQG